ADLLPASIPNDVHMLAFSPDGKRLAWCAGPETAIWDRKTGRVTHTFNQQGGARALEFSKDGNQLLVGRHVPDGPAIQIWDAKPPAEKAKLPVAPAKPLRALEKSGHHRLAWSPDGKRLVGLHSGENPKALATLWQ